MRTATAALLVIILPAPDGEASPGVPSPRDRYEALRERYDAPRSTYANDHAKAGAAARPFLALAREHPDDPAAVEALGWITTHCLYRPEAGEAMGLLAREHVASARLGPILRDIDTYYGDPFGPMETLFRAALAENPHREVRGLACLALARYLASVREKAVRDAYRHALFVRGKDVPFVPEPELTAADLDALTEEAATLLGRVIDEYGDVEQGGDTLGAAARSDRRELLDLAIGRTAPEIAGRDAAGDRFALSDYRGRVVVLSFSANWCAPCRAMYPRERALAERLEGRPFALLGINADEDEGTLRRSIESGEITWRCWWDGGPAGPICSAWNVMSFPTTYILDARGVIRYKIPHGVGLEEAVDTLLEEVEAAPAP